jgi:hypothetical protein
MPDAVETAAIFGDDRSESVFDEPGSAGKS